MATPRWLKSIGDFLRPIAQSAVSILSGGLIGGAVGGTSQSPTAVAATASVASQGATRDADLGKGAAAAGFMLTKENAVKLVIGGVLIFVIITAARKL